MQEKACLLVLRPATSVAEKQRHKYQFFNKENEAIKKG